VVRLVFIFQLPPTKGLRSDKVVAPKGEWAKGRREVRLSAREGGGTRSGEVGGRKWEAGEVV